MDGYASGPFSLIRLYCSATAAFIVRGNLYFADRPATFTDISGRIGTFVAHDLDAFSASIGYAGRQNHSGGADDFVEAVGDRFFVLINQLENASILAAADGG